MSSTQTERLRDLIQRSRQLDLRITQLQAAISELQRRCDTAGPARQQRRAARASRSHAP